jgi:hypothetical protein
MHILFHDKYTIWKKTSTFLFDIAGKKNQISESFLDHTISTQSINFLNIFTYSYVIL